MTVLSRCGLMDPVVNVADGVEACDRFSATICRVS
jgi:hypothetical protein